MQGPFAFLYSCIIVVYLIVSKPCNYRDENIYNPAFAILKNFLLFLISSNPFQFKHIVIIAKDMVFI